MFGSLFKKKDTQRHPSAVPKEGNQSLSTTEAAALTKKVAALTTQIEQITDDKDKRHLLYNQLGATHWRHYPRPVHHLVASAASHGLDLVWLRECFGN